jgi:hypothetical protein
MAKNYSWGGLVSLACGFLFVALLLLCGAFFGPKPVGRNPAPCRESQSGWGVECDVVEG